MNGLGKWRGVIRSFVMLTSECYIGRRWWQTPFWTSHRGSLGVSQSEPSRSWCHESFRSSTCVLHGKLLCKSPDLKEGWGKRKNCVECLEFTWKWSVGRGTRQAFAGEEINWSALSPVFLILFLPFSWLSIPLEAESILPWHTNAPLGEESSFNRSLFLVALQSLLWGFFIPCKRRKMRSSCG